MSTAPTSAPTGAQQAAYAIADRLRAAGWLVRLVLCDDPGQQRGDGTWERPATRTVTLHAERGREEEALQVRWTLVTAGGRPTTRRGVCRYSTTRGARTLRSDAALAEWVLRAVRAPCAARFARGRRPAAWSAARPPTAGTATAAARRLPSRRVAWTTPPDNPMRSRQRVG